MPRPSDHDPSIVRDRPDPFASLASRPASRRFWLIELLMAPFQDDDERASYRTHQKNGRTARAKGGDGYAAAPAFVPAYNGSGPVAGNGHMDGRASGHA